MMRCSSPYLSNITVKMHRLMAILAAKSCSLSNQKTFVPSSLGIQRNRPPRYQALLYPWNVVHFMTCLKIYRDQRRTAILTRSTRLFKNSILGMGVYSKTCENLSSLKLEFGWRTTVNMCLSFPYVAFQASHTDLN